MKKLFLAGIYLCMSGAAMSQGLPSEGSTDRMIAQYQDIDPIKSKTYSKSFVVGASDKILVSNQYGDVQIRTWDKKEVRADVEIRANSKNDKDAQRLLDGASISASQEGSEIAFRTTLARGNDGGGTWFGKSVFRRELHVNYIIYVPASNSLSVSNQYGHVHMDDFSGPLYMKVQYGNFTGGRLMSDNNYISVQYGKMDIQELGKATLKQQYGSGLAVITAGTLDVNAQYAGVNIGTIKGNAVIKQQYGSGLNIGTVQNLELNAQYANVSIGTVKGNALIKQQYNNLKIGNSGKIELTGQYAGVNITTLNGDGSFNMDYNKLTLGEVFSSCKSLSIDGDYLDINLGFDDRYRGDLEVRTSYANFKYGSSAEVKIAEGSEKSWTKLYSGKIGNGGVGHVAIKANYGGITIR